MKKLMDANGNLSYAAPVTGTPPTLPSPSAKVKAPAGGAGCFFGGLSFTIPPGATDGTCTTTVPAPGTISPSATKELSGGQAAVLDGDQVTVSGITGILSGGGACTLSVTVKANASQTKALGV